MSFIADAAVRISAFSQGVDQAFGRVEQKLQSAGQAMTAVGARATAAGAAITGAVTGILYSFTGLGDELDKMSLRTGIGVEALSEFRHAARLSGTSLGTVEAAVRRMQRTIFEAGDGVATYVDALTALGLEYEDLEGKTPEEQLSIMLEHLADVEDATDRAAIAQEIFGRSGTQLLPMLAKGSEGLREMRQEAHELGIVMTEEDADAAAQFNDDFQRVRDALRGVWQEIARELVPTMISLFEKAKEIIVAGREWVSNHRELAGVLVTVAAAVGGVLTVVGPLLIGLGMMTTGAAALIPVLLAVKAGILGVSAAMLANPIGLVIAAIAALTAALLIFVDDWGVIWDTVKMTVVDVVKGIWAGIMGVVDAFALAGAGIRDIGVAIWDGLALLGAWAWDVLGTVGEAFGAIPGVIGRAVYEAWNWAVDLLAGFIERIFDGRDALFDAGRRFIQWIWDGMKSLAGEVARWMRNFIDRITPDFLIDFSDDEAGGGGSRSNLGSSMTAAAGAVDTDTALGITGGDMTTVVNAPGAPGTGDRSLTVNIHGDINTEADLNEIVRRISLGAMEAFA